MKRFHKVMLWLAAIGLVIPQLPAVAAGPQPAAQASQLAVTDVALSQDGLLHGQIVDRSGAPRASVPVLLYSGDQVVGQSKTDQQGNFAIPLAKGGVYRLSDNQASTMLRVWTNPSAPPAAKSGVLLVSDQGLVRAQLGDGQWLPYLLVGGVVAGIVIIATAERHEGS